MIYALLATSDNVYYVARYAPGQTYAEAVLSRAPVTVDLANLTPGDFTGPAFAAAPDPALFSTLTEIFQYAPGTGAITASYTPTAAEYAAHFDVDTNAPGIPGWKTLQGTDKFP